jgi:hypothetical protein
LKRELDDTFKAYIVQLIIDKKTEQAIESLSQLYEIKPPQIVVGTIKGKRRTVYAVYVQRECKIYCINSDIFYNPFIIMHEFYHHLRTTAGVHRGSEKNANLYARDFIDSYNTIINDMIQKTKDI